MIPLSSEFRYSSLVGSHRYGSRRYQGVVSERRCPPTRRPRPTAARSRTPASPSRLLRFGSASRSPSAISINSPSWRSPEPSSRTVKAIRSRRRVLDRVVRRRDARELGARAVNVQLLHPRACRDRQYLSPSRARMSAGAPYVAGTTGEAVPSSGVTIASLSSTFVSLPFAYVPVVTDVHRPSESSTSSAAVRAWWTRNQRPRPGSSSGSSAPCCASKSISQRRNKGQIDGSA